jgi:hypothetical protein
MPINSKIYAIGWKTLDEGVRRIKARTAVSKRLRTEIKGTDIQSIPGRTARLKAINLMQIAADVSMRSWHSTSMPRIPLMKRSITGRAKQHVSSTGVARFTVTIHTRKRFPATADDRQVKVFSAATTWRRESWCAVGDATMSFDPLSGLGVQHAIDSAIHAADSVRKYLAQHQGLDASRKWVKDCVKRYLVERQQYYSRARNGGEVHLSGTNVPYSPTSDTPLVKPQNQTMRMTKTKRTV